MTKIQKTNGIVEGACGLNLEFKQWHNGQNLVCDEIDTGVTSYPRRPLGKVASRFCFVCENNPYTIRKSSGDTTK